VQVRVTQPGFAVVERGGDQPMRLHLQRAAGADAGEDRVVFEPADHVLDRRVVRVLDGLPHGVVAERPQQRRRLDRG